MATMARPRHAIARGEVFFVNSALLMAAVIVLGFSFQLGMHRSTFAAPLRVHLHAFVFFGWTVLYVAQNVSAATGSRALHRTLGWLSVGGVPAMILMGTYVTVAIVQEGRAPFFFQPAYFLVMNPLSILVFAGLTAAAIVQRRRTEWHRRLMFCGMTILLGPAFGRLLPLPFTIPYTGWAVFAAFILFPIAGVIRDLRATGRVHPAWWWGIGTLVAMQVATTLITFSPVGAALYRIVTAGHPGAALAPFAFPPFPSA